MNRANAEIAAHPTIYLADAKSLLIDMPPWAH